MITDLDDVLGATVVAAILAAGGAAHFLHQDVADEAGWPGVVEETERRYGRLDIVVANAGIGIWGSVFDMTLADWRRQTAVNLDGVFLSVKYAVPALRRAGGGSIVMISSVAGLRGAPGLAGYSATKGGVRLFAKSVAMECAAAGFNIRVNSVHPGIIATPIWTKIQSKTGANAAIDPYEIGALAVPLGKAGEAQDIANGVLFLASEASSHITASELVIDGGMTGGAVPRGGATR
jgi:NAD(P)-dependent dehydrogenase (short-subunit alcohol dehydrogenase family)